MNDIADMMEIAARSVSPLPIASDRRAFMAMHNITEEDGRPIAPRPPSDLLSFTPSEFQVVLQQLRAFRDEFCNDASTRQPLPEIRIPLPPPPPCSFLSHGQTFIGWQRVTHHWGKDWSALSDTDIRHWSKFSAFKELKKDVDTWGGRAPELAACSKIFMRWKEHYFVTGGECRLTIAGFYYCCLDRATGSIEAIYFDPASSPDQRLQLTACPGGECGYAFSAHELA